MWTGNVEIYHCKVLYSICEVVWYYLKVECDKNVGYKP